ncbi:hypothetical protein [Paraburkholderia sp.]|uniref:hypothetical protein n=1 Tax=Paraburkholderia sp. TaxID=1926495 RepID=UPI00262A7FD1|nr:hypothetical protein [Paraburkholderia sp.]
MKANIFQIFYDERTRDQIDPGFIALDNIENPRADWREYWAIREYFLNNTLNSNELYGFMSPSFGAKTGLSGRDVRNYIDSHPGHDVYTFSPFIQDAACYLNVFEQANLFHPGHVEIANDFLKELGIEVNLETLVMDFRTTVYCNYFVAKPSFWKTWFALTEKLFDICEKNDTVLANQLNSLTIYRLPVGMKVFLAERIASLVLALTPELAVCPFDVRAMPFSHQGFAQFKDQMVMLDNLKSGYLSNADESLLAGFFALRGAILKAVMGEGVAATKNGFIRTPRQVAPELLYVCLADEPLRFKYPSFVSTIHLGQQQTAGKVNTRDLAPEWEPYQTQLGALAGCFALKSYIVKTRLQVRRVGLCTPNEFVTNHAIGDRVGADYAHEFEPAMLDAAVLADAMEPGTRDFVVGDAPSFQRSSGKGPWIDQYADAHFTEDLLRFIAEAVEQGVLNRAEVVSFFAEERFVPGGIGLGVFPTDFWVRSITGIETVVRGCIQRYGKRMDNARMHNWVLCAERFGSYLLLNQLQNAYAHTDWRAKFIGQSNEVQQQPVLTEFVLSL